MDINQKIVAFNEGLLTQEEEQQFLYEMMSDPGLRDKFRKANHFERELKSSAQSIKPSPKLRQGVFAAAGLTDTSAATVASVGAASTTAATSFLKFNFLRSYTGLLAVGIVSSVLTVLLTYFLLSNDSEVQDHASARKSTSDNDLYIASKPIIISNDINDDDFYKEYSNQENTNNSIKSSDELDNKSSEKATSNNMHSQKLSILDDKSTKANDLPAKSLEIARLNGSNPEFNPLPLNYRSNLAMSSINMPQFGLPHRDYLSHLGLYLECSGLNNFFNENTMLEQNSISLLNNFSAGIYYQANDYASIGISLSHETFFLRYYDSDEDLTYKQIDQYSDVIAANISLCFEYPINNYLSPYYKVSAGFGKYGAISGLSAGVSIIPINSIEMFAEAGLYKMSFSHDSENYKSEKFTVRYGFKYYLD